MEVRELGQCQSRLCRAVRQRRHGVLQFGRAGDEEDVDAVLLRHRGDLGGVYLDGRGEGVGGGRVGDGAQVPVAEGPCVAVAEDEDGVQAAVDVAARKAGEQVRVALALGCDGLAAALQPGPQAWELVGGADQPDPDGARGVAGGEVGRAVAGDPEPRVDVTAASAEFKLRLGYHLSVHCTPYLASGPAAVVPTAGRSAWSAAARPRPGVRVPPR